MTPYDKAQDLLDKFTPVAGLSLKIATGWGKELSGRCCDEIISLLSRNKNLPTRIDYYSEQITYWQQVKAEIEKL